MRLVEDNSEDTTGQQVHSRLCPCALKYRVAATLNLEHLPDPLCPSPKVKFCGWQMFHQSLRTRGPQILLLPAHPRWLLGNFKERVLLASS